MYSLRGSYQITQVYSVTKENVELDNHNDFVIAKHSLKFTNLPTKKTDSTGMTTDFMIKFAFSLE